MSSTTTHAHKNLGFYVGILVALFVLTVLTYFTARQMHTGLLHTPLAIGIATVKAFLVAWYFMHLKEHSATNKMYFATGVFFVLLMIALVVGDAWARPLASNPNFPAFREMRGPW